MPLSSSVTPLYNSVNDEVMVLIEAFLTVFATSFERLVEIVEAVLIADVSATVTATSLDTFSAT